METYELTLTTMTYGGDCLGRLPEDSPFPGLAVFVPYGLPGERVRVRILEKKRGHARAELLEIITPSPDRIIPRCPHHFSTQPEGEGNPACGGCHYQHLSYANQLATKTDILRNQLERIGRITDPPLQPVIPSPSGWNYRNHIQFHISNDGKLGFESSDHSGVIPIQECHLPQPILNNIWPQLDLEPVPGLERIGLRAGSDEDILLTLVSDEPFEFNVEDLPLSAVQVGSGGSMVLAGSDYVFIDVLERSFRVSAESFFQVNTAMAANMVEHIIANLSISPSDIVLDVYCGVGLFSAFLAPQAAKLIGIEISPSACDDFAFNLDEFNNVDLYQAAAEDVLAEIDLKPDVILVDPPRAGLAPLARQAILNKKPKQLAYVSCDPATLARDAHHLIEGGYHLRQITPFDLFPQTYHIESISFWEC